MNRSASYRMIAVALTAAVLLVASRDARAQTYEPECWFKYGSTPLHWDVPTIPVYLNVSDENGVQLSGHYFLAYLSSLLNAMSVWNEDGGAPVRFVYAGLTYEPTVEGGVVARGSAGCSQYAGTAGGSHDAGIYYQGTVTMIRRNLNNGCADHGHVTNPRSLRDVLVHELGHTLGRNDAYQDYNTCDELGYTVMFDVNQSLRQVDKEQHQAVYGQRFGTPEVRRLSASGGSWSAPAALSGDEILYRAGSVDSYDQGISLLPHVQRAGPDGNEIRVARFSGWGYVFDESIVDESVHTPVAAASAPDGSAVLAFLDEDVWSRHVCYRTSTDSGATWGPKVCPPGGSSVYENTYRNAISAGYDPVSKMFIIAWVRLGGGISLMSVPSASSTYVSRRGSIANQAADAPQIACSQLYYPFDPSKNCRLVFPSGNTYGQQLEWVEFDLSPFGGFFWFGPTRHSTIQLNQAPGVAWWNNKFHMVYTTNDRDVKYRDMARTGTSWAYRGTLNSTGQVSAPELGTARFCFFGCTDMLDVHWLRFE